MKKDNKAEKAPHGGARPGAGRKSPLGKTVVMRVPLRMVEAVRKFIAEFKA